MSRVVINRLLERYQFVAAEYGGETDFPYGPPLVAKAESIKVLQDTTEWVFARSN